MCTKPLQRGMTLIELIVFIVIVSVGVVGLVSVINPMVRFSAEPMRQKQLMAVAESLLNEIVHQPYTWCDLEDDAALTATSYADCAHPQNTGSGESRTGTGPGTNFDNVADYAGFSMNDFSDAAGNNVMTGYNVSVTVVPAGVALGVGSDDAALAITVTVTRDGQSFALTGYRFRYAPRS
ncbi:MAG: prepilin-type N-terminal cleavage/methylation domain-containing protein [Rhodocyclales bacterium GT-UBC]|nr:MAG: prepilin-type N-terminal cleavage/methylation domain-containing protein [Rhodocyclales bacterium GT-UBC]